MAFQSSDGELCVSGSQCSHVLIQTNNYHFFRVWSLVLYTCRSSVKDCQPTLE